MKNFSIILMSIFLLGCRNVMGGAYNYNIEIRNIGTQDVDKVELSSSKGFFTRVGILIPGAGDTYQGPIKFPFRDKFSVKWVSADNQKFSKTLDLTDKIRKEFKGRPVLKIDKNNTLSFEIQDFDGNPIETK